MTLAEALQRLRSAEHSSKQLQQQVSMTVPRQVQTNVAQVNNVGQGQGQGHDRKNGKYKKNAKTTADINKKKQKLHCANCDANSHWYVEGTTTTGKELKPKSVQHMQTSVARSQLSRS